MEGSRSRRALPIGGGRLLASAAVVLAAVLGLVVPAAHGSYTVVAQNGPAKNRVNIVILGDGYTAGELDTTYTDDINRIVDYVFGGDQDPFPRYKNFFNVYRVDLTSAESGADVPPLGIYRNTALDASYYYNGGPERLLYINQSKADAALKDALAGSGITANLRWVTVNDSRYGGGGGGYTVFAGGNTYAGELALHETGHSFGGLADEYVDPSYGQAPYSGPEPYAVNVTKDPSGGKWSQWLGYVDALGTVGAYEGADYYAYGLYRPTPTSKMKALGQPFNAVSREKIVQDIYGLVHPLDACLSPFGIKVDPPQLWVDLVDPNVLQVEWYVEGVQVPGATGETFRMSDYGYGPGTYNVEVHAFDPTEWVRVGRNALEQYVSWTVELTPEPGSLWVLWTGAVILLRRSRRRKGQALGATRPRT